MKKKLSIAFLSTSCFVDDKAFKISNQKEPPTTT